MVLIETNSPLDANDVQFAALVQCATSFFLRTSEWWLLDHEALAFVGEDVEFLHLLFEVSKGDEYSHGVYRLAAHRPGCPGSSTKPCIVLTPEGRFHSVFGCTVCYMAFHLKMRSITHGPVSRHKSRPDMPIPMRQVWHAFAKRLVARSYPLVTVFVLSRRTGNQ